MPRNLRDDYPGAWHHAMNRTIAPLSLLADDVDARIFIVELREASLKCRVDVHAFCLMRNHFHLLIHTPDGGLSKMMQTFSARFTQHINRRRDRDGPLFRGRFKSVAIDSDGQLLQTSVYIHRNPVAAGLVSSAEDWLWSSARNYINERDRFDWLHTSDILDMNGTSSPRLAYRELLMG